MSGERWSDEEVRAYGRRILTPPPRRRRRRRGAAASSAFLTPPSAVDTLEAKLRRLLEHPSTNEHEADAARRILDRIRAQRRGGV